MPEPSLFKSIVLNGDQPLARFVRAGEEFGQTASRPTVETGLARVTEADLTETEIHGLTVPRPELEKAVAAFAAMRP
jgi:hypothetical protein